MTVLLLHLAAAVMVLQMIGGRLAAVVTAVAHGNDRHRHGRFHTRLRMRIRRAGRHHFAPRHAAAIA